MKTNQTKIYQHKDLAAGRWKEMPFVEQMANVGGEVERALNWQNKNNPTYSKKAAERALELMDLTIDAVKISSHYKELTRLREALVDYFFYANEFSSTEKSWRKYFGHFTFAARRNA